MRKKTTTFELFKGSLEILEQSCLVVVSLTLHLSLSLRMVTRLGFGQVLSPESRCSETLSCRVANSVSTRQKYLLE